MNKMKAVICLLSSAMIVWGVFSQEDADPAALLAAQADAAAADPAALLASQADAAAKLLPAVQDGGAVTAEDAVMANLAKLGVSIGYDRKRHAIIAVGTAEVSMKDPANDKSFMLVRNAKANQAYLSAKAEVIKSIYTQMSAVDRLEVAGSFGEKIDTEEYDAKRKELESKRVELAKKLTQLDRAAAAELAGVTLGDRFAMVLDAVMKKFDARLGADKVAAEKRALRDSLKLECASLKLECEALEKKAAAIAPPEPATKQTSELKMLSKMPLLGASVITQAESWDEVEQVYSVSMAVIWSPAMQEVAISLVSGGEAVKMTPGRFEPREWIARQNLLTMIGPRRFTDNEGNNIFVGISAVDLTGPVKNRAPLKKLADANARKYVAFSLAGDLETFTEASSNYAEYDDDNRSAVESLAEKVSQKCSVAISGCTQLGMVTGKHPITGRLIYVSAFYIDPVANKDASQLLKQSFEAARRQAVKR